MKTPQLRKYKSHGREIGRVIINGRHFYCGPWGTHKCIDRYKELIGQQFLKIQVPASEIHGLTVNGLIAMFTEWAEARYQKHGRPTSEIHCHRAAARFLSTVAGELDAAAFGPSALLRVRSAMVADGQARSSIQRHMHRIRWQFRWAASQELIPFAVYDALRTLPPLRHGEALATIPKTSPTIAQLRAIWPHLPAVVKDMIRVQRLCGARPGELVTMHDKTIHRVPGLESWVYVPTSHKTEHLGKKRAIPIGPRAQAIMAGYIGHGFLWKPPRNSKTRRYTTNSYLHAIHRACTAAGIPHFGPNAFRHMAAERIERIEDIATAGRQLGHSTPSTTLTYVKLPGFRKHLRTMDRIG